MSTRQQSGLSKSLFIRGLQCHRSLYLHKNHPELKSQLSNTQQVIFRSGDEVGELARQIFPCGVLVPYEGLSIASQIRLTNSLIDNGVKTIYEASFDYDGIFIKVDILRKGRGGWEVYEVKSSTGVKDVHCRDAALQCYVLENLGMKITKVAIVHIDNSYVRQGDIDVHSLFTIASVKSEVEKLKKGIKKQISRMRKMLIGEEPNTDIGLHCSTPYDCDFIDHCWKHIPEDSVFSLAGRGIDKFDYYRRGIIKLADIPLEDLNKRQALQAKATLKKKNSFDKEAVQEFLDELWYPLCHLDFETFTSPIPLFDRIRPYQQVPFQYSLHIQDKKGAEPEHFEFLAQPGEDPRKKLLNQLLREIPVGACVLAYNMGFEKKVLQDLALFVPRREKRINRIREDMRDLMQPFRSQAVYHWQMKGSYSIKAVLPALVPELSYKGMEIADGGMAMDAYHQMCAMINSGEIEKIRKALLSYCELDTLAMVKILEHIM